MSCEQVLVVYKLTPVAELDDGQLARPIALLGQVETESEKETLVVNSNSKSNNNNNNNYNSNSNSNSNSNLWLSANLPLTHN